MTTKRFYGTFGQLTNIAKRETKKAILLAVVLRRKVLVCFIAM